MKALWLGLLLSTLFLLSQAAPSKKCKCKPTTQLVIKCAENEEPGCHTCKETTCAAPEEVNPCLKSPPTCCKFDACFCKEGYARKNGKCVVKAECSSHINAPDCKIDEYEHLQLAISDGNPTCRNREAPYPLPTSKLPRCVCDKKRVRNAKGECILPSECTETDNNHIYEAEKPKFDPTRPPIIFENGTIAYPLSPQLPKPQQNDATMPKIFVFPPPSASA